MDESWVMVNKAKAKVIAKSDWTQAPAFEEDAISMHITTIMCICADGSTLPTTAILPLVHFPDDLQQYHKFLCWSGSKKGWITTEIYTKWIEDVFIPQANPCPLSGQFARSLVARWSLYKMQ